MTTVYVLSRRAPLIQGLCRGALNEGTPVENAHGLSSFLEPSQVNSAGPHSNWLLVADAAALKLGDLPTLKLLKTQYPECRILLIFTLQEREIASQAISQGIDAYVLDPFSLDEFSAIIRRLADQVTESGELASAYRMDVLTIFLRGLSHELNNPLATISGILQLLLHPSPEPETQDELQRKYLIMQEGLSRINTLLKELEYFIRVRRAERGLVAIDDLLRQAIKEVCLRTGTQPFDFETDSRPPQILVDREQMVFALSNLFRYAIRHVHCAEDLKATVSRSDESDSLVLSTIVPGKPTWPEDLDRLFVPFYSRTGRDFAEGLSLSAAYGIVRGHNGRIRIEPISDEAFRIDVELPTGEAEIRTEPPDPD